MSPVNPFFVGQFPNWESMNIHPETKCAASEYCAVHRPSDHHMRYWPMKMMTVAFLPDYDWSAFLVSAGEALGVQYVPGVIMRRCPHKFMHPDPDSFAALQKIYHLGESFYRHPCDGCCCPHGLHINALFRTYACGPDCEAMVFGPEAEQLDV